MNEAIIKNFNESVGWEDRLYILGDVMMGQDIEAGCRLLGRLPGEKYIIRGNHDSDKKAFCYGGCGKREGAWAGGTV